MRSGETICETERYDATMCSCCIPLDGTFVAVGFENGNIKVWDNVVLNWWFLQLHLTGRGNPNPSMLAFILKFGWVPVGRQSGNSQR